MSTTYSVPSRRLASWVALRAAVGPEGLVAAEGDPDAAWTPGVLHLHEDGVSARGVELARSEEAYTVRVPANASLPDWDLALRLLRALALQLDARIHRDGRDAPYDPVEFEAHHRPAALGKVLAAEFATLARAAEAAPVALAGPIRTAFVGPATIARLVDGGPPEEVGARLGDLVARVQWIDREGYAVAGVLAFESPDGRTWKAAAVIPGPRLFVPHTPHLLLAEPGGSTSPMVVDASTLAQWAGPGLVETVDERQVIVHFPKGSDWDEAWDRAAPHVRVRVQQAVPEPAVEASEATPDDDLADALDAPEPDDRRAATAARPRTGMDDEATEETPRPPLPPRSPGTAAKRRPWWKFW